MPRVGSEDARYTRVFRGDHKAIVKEVLKDMKKIGRTLEGDRVIKDIVKKSLREVYVKELRAKTPPDRPELNKQVRVEFTDRKYKGLHGTVGWNTKRGVVSWYQIMAVEFGTSKMEGHRVIQKLFDRDDGARVFELFRDKLSAEVEKALLSGVIR